MTYEQFIAIRDQQESIAKESGRLLDLYPKSSSGLTNESAKDQKWYNLRQTMNAAKSNVDKLYKAEKAHYKRMLKDTKAEIEAKRAAKLAQLAAA